MNQNIPTQTPLCILYSDNPVIIESLKILCEKNLQIDSFSYSLLNGTASPAILLIDVENPAAVELFKMSDGQPTRFFRIAVLNSAGSLSADSRWTGYYDNVLYLPCQKPHFENIIKRASGCLARYNLPEFYTGHIISNIQQTVVIIDTRGTILFVNRYFEELSGWTSEELIGKNSYDFFLVKKMDRRFYSVFIKKMLRKGAFPRVFELALYMKNGEQRLFSWSSVPIPDNKGNIFSIAGIAMDITEKREMNKALAKSEQRFRMLADSIDDVFYMVDLKNHRTIYSNARFEELWGFTADDLEQKNENFMKVIHPEDRETFSSNMKAVRMNPRPFEFDFRIIRNGEIRWLRERGNPILSWNSKRPLLVGIETDITKHKEHEEALKYNLREKETMLKEIHHRVKNNLNIINSLLSLQSGTINSTDEARTAFIKTTNRVRSMALVHEQMYKQSTIISINMQNIIRNIIRINRGSIHFQGLVKTDIQIRTVDLSLDQVIPLSLIFNEIASNAFLYAFPDNYEGLLRVSLGLKGSEVEFVVSDNGLIKNSCETLKEKGALGYMLIKELTNQLKGTLDIQYLNGLEYRLLFPLD